MARKKLSEVSEAPKTEIAKQTELSKLVASYGANKENLDKLDKQCKAENASIKELMVDLKCTEYESGGYLAKYSVQQRESMNEDKLLEMLSNDCGDLCRKLGIIKTKEYIDGDALEQAIYNEKISKKIILKMDKCRDSKDVPMLRISKMEEK